MTAPLIVEDDWSDDFYEPGPGSSWRGPGRAGGEVCVCGTTFSWPENTTEEDRATMIRLFDEHEASCPVAHPEPVQPDAPRVPISPRDVAELTIRRGCRLVNALRAAGLSPERAAS